jgi:hypothetical protein
MDDEQWTINSVIEYISENFIGLILLVFAFLIIYFVDHINNLNTIILSSQTSLPQLDIPIKVKSKKLKKS